MEEACPLLGVDVGGNAFAEAEIAVYKYSRKPNFGGPSTRPRGCCSVNANYRETS
jgi:hypothetical protein